MRSLRLLPPGTAATLAVLGYGDGLEPQGADRDTQGGFSAGRISILVGTLWMRQTPWPAPSPECAAAVEWLTGLR